jgi:general secretion pathway protein K
VSHKHLLKDQKGVALLLALLTVSFLVTMTMQLLVDVDGQVEDAALVEKTLAMENAVYSGLSIVQAALYSDQQATTYDSLLDSWAGIDGEQLTSLTDDISLTCAVNDLSGKLQIHALLANPLQGGNGANNTNTTSAQEQQQQLEKVEQVWTRFLLSGKFAIGDEQQVEALLDAIRDWIDEDDDARINGAENAYYQSLSPGYSCRNGAMLAVEELLFVKGVTPALFYGDEEHEGIAAYITVAGDDGKINLNTAPDAVLAALNPELNEDMISELQAYREEPDNSDNLADPTWYKNVSGFPGDITLDENLLTVSAKAFALTITAATEDGRCIGKGVLLRGENHEQTLVHWQIQ